MTAIISGVFSLSFVYVAHYVERYLVSKSLDKTLDRVLDDVRQGRPPRLDYDMAFFASDHPGYAIPENLASARVGFNEFRDYWAYVREKDGQRYILLEDQYEFESHERVMLGVLAAALALSIVGAWALGGLVARKVMAPVSRLAEAVRDLDPSHPPGTPLARDYADDEVGRLAAAFDDTLRGLNRAMERERLFTSDVSHELRTPLMIVATSCELLEAAELPPHARERVDRIARAAREMRNLVETFLMLARAVPQGRRAPSEPPARALRVADDSERDAERPDASAVDPGAWVELAAAANAQTRRWAESIRAKGLDFEVVEKEKGGARYNAAFLNTVLDNLLRNALHYTDHGRIRLVLDADGFCVEDSGSGIAESERDKVFQAFVRGSEARGEGLGLGLSLVKRICEHEGWRIALEVPPEGGSRFRVRLRYQETGGRGQETEKYVAGCAGK
ncbi:MAG: HAMP domain-containing histidine kinase [Candidatus Accumulibacter sp.]|nr:HAMP domain-containing histidine kinase [Accumulibacter sp.]